VSQFNVDLTSLLSQVIEAKTLGLGVYAIHLPNVLSVEWVTYLVERAQKYIPKERLWVSPYCGLKTR
jgi:5-methyltetrahydropteroyltriglutamate--homocysteine methyltransferase